MSTTKKCTGGGGGVKRSSYSLQEKMDIIAELRRNPCKTLVSKGRGMGVCTVSRIWREREEIERQFRSKSGGIRRCRGVKFEVIDEHLLGWVRRVQEEGSKETGDGGGALLSGPLLMEKAREFAVRFGISGFKCSNGWLHKWKKRHGIQLRGGERASGTSVEDNDQREPLLDLLDNTPDIKREVDAEDDGMTPPSNDTELAGQVDDLCNPGATQEKEFPKLKHSEIKLLSHCPFCLRETSIRKMSEALQKMDANHFELRQSVPRAENSSSSTSSLLSTLNKLWPYLQQQNNERGYADSMRFLELGGGGGGTATFTDLPKMCKFCAVKLESVQGQFVELMKEVHQLEKVVRESQYGGRYSWRAEHFERTLRNSDLEQETIEATLETLGNLGKEPSFEDCGRDNAGSDPDYIKEEPEDDEGSDSSTFADFMEVEDSMNPEDNPKPPPKTTKKNRKRAQEIGKAIDKPNRTTPTDKNVVCDLCGFQTTQEKYLAQHKKHVHENPKSSPGAKCDLCKDLVPPADMYAHVREHIGDDDYCIRCPNPNCCTVYSQPFSMSLHLNRNKRCKDCLPSQDAHKFPDKGPTCDTCGFSTRSARDLRGHLTEKHENDSKIFSCPISGCQRRFTLRQSVVLHLPHHDFCRKVTSQLCDLCRKRLQCSEMEQHLKDDHQAAQIINCNHCAFLFTTRESLIGHLFSHRHGTLTCDICSDGVKYSRYSALRDHYFDKHKLGKRFECDQCEGVGYWKKHNLLDHKMECHHSSNQDSEIILPGKPKTTYKCEECNVAYRSLYSLKDHNIKLHRADLHRCKFCGATFSKSWHWRDHEVKAHRPAKSISCDVEGCGRVFNNRYSVRRHYRVDHLGIRKHVCEICGKSYTDYPGLKAHKDSVHLGLRPHVCSECGEGFQSGSVLKRHMLIHTGERPYSCDLCGQRFRTGEVLRRHLEGHQRKGVNFKPNGPMKEIRKRVAVEHKKL